MASIKYEVGTLTTLLDTELNSLANGSGAVDSGSYDNATDLYLWGLFELTVTWGTNPTLGNLCNLYLIPSVDGTNYDDNVTGASPYAPSRAYAGGFPVRATTSIQRIPLGFGQSGLIALPPRLFKAFLINNSGQAMPASGNLLKVLPMRYQSV